MKKTRRRSPKLVLRLPDLEHAKSAVLNSLTSPESRRSYEFAIQNFVHWYCSEPRLALNRIVLRATGCSWNSFTLLLPPLISVWPQCEGWPTRLPTPAY